MSSHNNRLTRPISEELHPLATGQYRIATPAIQAFYELISRCLRYRITGALIYGPPRIGKTKAIEYIRLLLAEKVPTITTYHVQAEHKPRHAEGPFFANLLEAVGYPDASGGSNSAKRQRLINKIREACIKAGRGTVILFCDEAQRFDENEYEWLRDIHDHLDRMEIKLFTFLVGQQDLLSIKTNFQRSGKMQIVARLMVEELAFYGVRDVNEVATCLAGYGQTFYPRGSEWSFTRFYLQQAVDAGYVLTDDAQLIWTTFENIHNKAGFSGAMDIPMESFTRAVEIVLKDAAIHDAPAYRPPPALWEQAIRHSGYTQIRIATSRLKLALREA
ncbi:AAA family ATPase [Glaciimonas sp. GNP009]